MSGRRSFRGLRLLPRRVAACLGFLLCFLLSGCGGSSLDAGYAVAANNAVQGYGSGASAEDRAPTDSAVVPGPGTVSGPDPGAPAAPAGTGSPTGNAGPSTPADEEPQASCAGFRNQRGITDETITVATVADVTGPVPGIFSSAQQAVKAYVAYFNASSDLCGRKLVQLPLDSRTDASADQVAYTKACDVAFAVVGSMSAFDAGGAATANACKIPDLRSQAVSDARNACRTCFGAQATELDAFQNAIPDFLLEHYAGPARHAAMLYVNAAASVQNAKNMMRVESGRGMEFVYASAFDVAEFNYLPYVQKMKEHGVRLVQFVGSPDQAVRMARTMQDARFHPEVYLLDPTAYTPAFARAGGAVDGAVVFVNFTPLEESNPELRLYRQWLRQVAPGATPSYFGLYAWSAARLFVEQATALGGDLTRASLVSALRGVHRWTANGLHAPQDVGGKRNGSCWRFLRLHDGAWKPLGGTAYLCHGSTR